MIRTIAYVFGALLAAMGIWGFLQNPVLGVFDSNTLQSLIHAISGAILLGVAAWSNALSSTLKIFGVIYALIAIVGFVVGGNTIFSVIDNSLANGILHSALAIIFLWAGFMGREERGVTIEPIQPSL